jgi:hypothetical protein
LVVRRRYDDVGLCFRIVVLCVMLAVVEFDRSVRCVALLWEHILGYLAILSGSLFVELFISVVAMRGGILDTEARSPMKYLLYIRLGTYSGPPHFITRNNRLQSKSKSHYDRQSVGQSVLVSGNHLGPVTNFSFSLKFPSDSCVFVIL